MLNYNDLIAFVSK